MEYRPGWRGVAFALVFAVVLAGPVGVFGGAVTSPTVGVGVAEAQESPTPTPTPTNDSAVRHENPESADGQGDLSDVQSWLSGRMGEVVVDCAQQVQIGSSYVCERLDEDYPQWASQYVDVAGDTPGSDDDNASRVLNETAETQQRFAEQTEEFRETQAEYEEAQENGNDQRAREIARELSRQAEDLNDTSANLTEYLELLNRNSGADVTEAIAATESVSESVTEVATEIRAREFVDTTVTARANASTVSFDDPVRVVGRLTSADGRSLSNRTVVLRTPEGSQTVRTDGDGRYAVVYRPRTASVGATELTVQYVPRETGLYRESTSRVGVDVLAVTPTLTVERTPAHVGFGQRLTVSGRVAVDDVGASEVPVVVRLGSDRLGAVRTTEDGRFTLTARIPAAVPPGSVTVESRVAQEDRALSSVATTTSVRLLRTATSLDARGERIGADEARVSGTLTANGTAVTDEPILVAYGERVVARGETDGSGGFDVEASLPASVDANESAALTVRYEPPAGRNLAGSETTAEVGAAPDDTSSTAAAEETGERGFVAATVDATSNLGPLGAAIGVLLAAGAAVVVYAFRDRLVGVLPSVQTLSNTVETGSQSAADDTAADDSSTDPAAGAPASEGESMEPATAVTGRTLLAKASEGLEERPGDAVVSAYAAVHEHLVDTAGIDPQSTHWELLTTCRDELDDRSAAALERLVTAYERAAFAPDGTTVERARAAVEAAGSVFDGGSDPSPGDD